MILKSDILNKVSEKDIMEYYYNEKIIDKKPIYKNLTRLDTKGTCYFNWYKNKYILVDRARGIDANFDCFDLVKYKYQCNFKESLIHINNDMNLGLSNKKIDSIPGRKVVKNNNKKTYYKRKVNYKIKSRKFNINDLFYWNNFGITLEVLNFYDVIPVSYYKSDYNDSFKFSLKYEHTDENPCYCYPFKGAKSIRVKLYKPLSKNYKWSSNVNSNDIFGLDKLPEKGDLLFIVSGGKDMMCIKAMDWWAIAGQSETQIISEDVINKLKLKFKKIIVLLDNDNTGVMSMKKYNKLYDLPYIILPKNTSCKDIADFVEMYGLNVTKNIINNLLKLQNKNGQ